MNRNKTFKRIQVLSFNPTYNFLDIGSPVLNWTQITDREKAATC